jgi:hypothetical protein
MADTIALLKEWLPSIASLATLAFVARVTWQTKAYLEDLATARRTGTLVEGDPKEHNDARKRAGLLGRTLELEDVAGAQTRAHERLWRLVRALLRGLGLPSDLSDADELETLTRDLVRRGAIKVDHIAAKEQLVSERDSRPGQRRHPALERAKNDTPPPVERRRPTGTQWRGKPPDSEGDE